MARLIPINPPNTPSLNRIKVRLKKMDNTSWRARQINNQGVIVPGPVEVCIDVIHDFLPELIGAQIGSEFDITLTLADNTITQVR